MEKTSEYYPVMKLPDTYKVFDFTEGYSEKEISVFIKQGGWGVGKYYEKRKGMYLAPQYENRRNIHIGVDIWAPAGEPVFAPLSGFVKYFANHTEEGNYGGTIVLEHTFERKPIFALYGHLSPDGLANLKKGQPVEAGEIIGHLGDESENGNWPPHLHFQLSVKDPGEADMPGVVSEEEAMEALERYPDPQIILGKLY